LPSSSVSSYSDAEDLDVERLLGRPDAGRDRTGQGSSCGLCGVDGHQVRGTVTAQATRSIRTQHMDAQALHHRARTRGVNPLVYWVVRAVMQPFFHVWFRLGRHGREHLPSDGALILAANHRSFLDPFVLGTMTRRPVYYVAKKELFANRLQAWFLNSLGAFPVDRGRSDQEMLTTAKAILERGDCVLIFPEGTRVRPGGLAQPEARRRGASRSETGAPGRPGRRARHRRTVRRGWRIRPHRVDDPRRAGPLTFPRGREPSKAARPGRHRPHLARAWPCSGSGSAALPPLRRAAIIGAGRVRTEPRAQLRRPPGRRARHPHARARRRPGRAARRITVARATDLALERPTSSCSPFPAARCPTCSPSTVSASRRRRASCRHQGPGAAATGRCRRPSRPSARPCPRALPRRAATDRVACRDRAFAAQLPASRARRDARAGPAT
jgi:1-acyl-sn-glycerol-3-phosphate acyltransferase